MTVVERTRYIISELIMAYGIMLFFMWMGKYFLQMFGIHETSLIIGGGIIVFLIGIKMVFPPANGVFGSKEGAQFLVPLAIPYLAGPSILALLMFGAKQNSNQMLELNISLIIAGFLSLLVLLIGVRLADRLSKEALSASEQLMGIVLTCIGVEMILKGVDLLFVKYSS